MELSNVSTMAQLAFGVNAVIGYMFTRYLSESRLFSEAGAEFIGVHEVEESTFDVEEEDLVNALERVLPEFKHTSRAYFIAMFYSFVCVVISFVVLVKASLYPVEQINSTFFIAVSALFVLINPFVYFVLDRRFALEFEHARELVEHMAKFADNDKEKWQFKSLIFYESFKRKRRAR